MSDLPSKIAEAQDFMRASAEEAGGAACVLLSGGKDSMAMLHLARDCGLQPAAVVYAEPLYPRRWKFLRTVLEAWNVVAFFPPPSRSWAFQEGSHFVLGQSFHTGGGELIDIPRDVIPWEAGEPQPDCSVKPACGIDFLDQPVGTMANPFKVAFCGHKDTDRDPVLGRVPLKAHRLATPEGCFDLAFPIKSWTDHDVWDYTAMRGIPVDEGKYDVPGRRAWPGNRANNDYLPACVRCLRAPEGGSVPCPKRGGDLVPSAAASVPWLASLERPHFATPDREEATS